MILCTACALLLAACLAACRSNSHYNPAKSHHREDGFRNNYPQPPRQSFWKWQWERWTGGVPDNPKEGYGFPLLKPDAAFLAANRGEPTLTTRKTSSMASTSVESTSFTDSVTKSVVS